MAGLGCGRGNPGCPTAPLTQGPCLECQGLPRPSPHEGGATEDRHGTRHARLSTDMSQDSSSKKGGGLGARPTGETSQSFKGFPWRWQGNAGITHTEASLS